MYSNHWLAQIIQDAALMGVLDTLTECITKGLSQDDTRTAIEKAARKQADDMVKAAYGEIPFEGWSSDEIAEYKLNQEG